MPEMYEDRYKALAADMLWVAICDLQAARKGRRPGKLYKKWLRDNGFDSPLQELEDFWRPSPTCSLFIAMITDAPPASIAEGVKSMGNFRNRQKLSLSAEITLED